MGAPNGDTRVPLLRVVELFVSAGLVASTITGLIWIGTIDERVSSLKDGMGKLDNAILGNRIAVLEARVMDYGTQQDRVERKIDRLLTERYGGGTP